MEEDYVPQNKLPDNTPRHPPPPTHDEILALCIKAIRANPKREPAARAHRLRNYALVLDRLAATEDEEWAAMQIAADRLREIAEEIVA